jgi:hypothetical protein
MIELYPPQQHAVEKLSRVLREGNIAANFSHTGTGKTLMNLAVAKELDLPTLVIAPLAAHATWWRWAKEMEINLLGVINCERLRLGKTPWVHVTGTGAKATYQWNLLPTTPESKGHLVIWDEIHRGLLGKDTATGRMAAMLRPQGIKTILASATPFNSPLNARALGYLFRLHNWSSGSFFSWCRAHGCTASQWHNGLEFNVESRAAKAHLERINQAIRDRCVKLTVDDLATQFPEGNIVEPCLIKLNERDEAEARRIYADMEEEVKKRNHVNALVEQTRARQRCELLKIPAMAEMVQDSVEEGFSVFVSLSFCDSVDAMLAELNRIGVTYAVPLVGKMNQKQRELSVGLFNQDLARILVASPAGGESISLHATEKDQRPRTSLISPNYSASQLVQALGRIKRAGMLDPVIQRIVLCAGTIEERVARRLQAKAHAIETITNSDLE